MHEGIGAEGEYLYPVFPFPWFTKVTRDDVLAHIAQRGTAAPAARYSTLWANNPRVTRYVR